MRLIDADKLPKYDGYALSAAEIAKAVADAPTIEAITTEAYTKIINEMAHEFKDAEPVVRCKDCKWIDLCKDPEHYEYKGANGFCSKGERKDEAEE